MNGRSPTAQADSAPQTPAGQIIMDYRYTYDAAGNITQRQTEEGTYQYAYDLIDRLTHATPPQHLQQNPITPEADKLPVEAYSYDPVHNRLSSQHQPGLWQYNQDNQLQSYGVGIERRSYTYTPNGHTATETTGDPAIKTREFIYNAAERLIEIKDNNQTIGQYQYDPMGRRIKKHTPEGTTWFLYSDEGLIAEVDPTGNPTRYYGWKPNGLWGTDPLWLADKATTAPNTWQPHLYHNDHLWTPQRLTNTQGEVQWSARSEAFGRTAAVINTTRNPLRFPGQYEDEQGLHYNFYRDYVPLKGGYVQNDPVNNMIGENSYLYALSNPISNIDSTGEWVWLIRIPPIFCARFPKVCNEIRLCAIRPSSCKKRYCNIANIVYHNLCDLPGGSACRRGEGCAATMLKKQFALGCFTQRLMMKYVCFGGRPDKTHDQQIKDALAKYKNCSALVEINCKDCDL